MGNSFSILNNKVINTTDKASGAGMHLFQSVLNMYSGTIAGNISEGKTFSQGAGVCTWDTNINLYDGSISNNKCIGGLGNGAGLWMSGRDYDVTFQMYGGSIVNNQANNVGGGFLIARGTNSTTNQSIAYLKGGTIANNVAKSSPNYIALTGAQIINQR